MFVLYGLLVGLIIGRVLGGEFARLAHARLRWSLAVVGAMLVQLAILGPLAPMIEPGAPVAVLAFVASGALGLAAAVANIRQPGVAVLSVGAGLNLLAIVANGGVMPASRQALEVFGWSGRHDGFSNSAERLAPAFTWLTDIFALPRWLPFANVFSVGDILIAIGCGVFIASWMLDMAPPPQGQRRASAAEA
jgi:hypothetical protein